MARPRKAAPRGLRAVTAADAPPVKPRTLKGAADCSERDLLVMMRTKIAATLDEGVPAHAQAPLYRQLRDIDKEIRALDAKARQVAEDVGCGGDEDWDVGAI